MADPRDHLGLVYREALRAARRYGGECGEWVGFVYEIMDQVCRDFKPAIGAFSSYAIKTIRWRAFDEFKREQRRFSELPEELPARPIPEPIVERMALTPRQREVLSMRMRGMRIRDIREELHIGTRTLRADLDDIYHAYEEVA